MTELLLRASSVGRLTNQILEINPNLGTREIIEMIRQCTVRREGSIEEFGAVEVIDEQAVLTLAAQQK